MTVVSRTEIKCDEPGCPATFRVATARFVSKGRRPGTIRARARGQNWMADHGEDRCPADSHPGMLGNGARPRS